MPATEEDTHSKNRKKSICHLCLDVFQKQEPNMIIGWCGLDGEAEIGKTVLFYMIDEKSEQIKENNNTIRNLTGEYKKIEPDCREGVRAQLERMKEICKERNNLYEKQNDLKGRKWKIEKSLER